MVVYIKTHCRPDKQLTYQTLRRCGYTGEIVFVVDDEDKTVRQLESNVSNDKRVQIKIFCKEEMVQKIDCGTNNPKRNVNLYAWCACEEIHRVFRRDEIFVMADDDITDFRFRYLEDGKMKSVKITQNMDNILDYLSEFMVKNNVTALSSGIPQMYFNKDLDATTCNCRVPYNFVMRNTLFEMNWKAEFQEEIITSIESSNRGEYIMAFPMIQHTIMPLGKEAGGMHDAYASDESFKLSQYGHIWHPTAEVPMLYKGKWITSIKREKAFPKLISSSCKKN